MFEYLLQKHIFPYDRLKAEDVVQRIEESTTFTSLWGAVRVALQMYLDAHKVGDAPVLVALSTNPSGRVQAMMVDTLVEYGLNNPEKVDSFVSGVLLDLKAERRDE